MRQGRPRKLRMKKAYKRRLYGMRRRGASNPKQKAAAIGRRRVRRRK